MCTIIAVKKLKYQETRVPVAAGDHDSRMISSLIVSLTSSNPTLMPDVMLSRWWKRKSGDIMYTNLFPSESQREFSCNPRTKLDHISRYVHVFKLNTL